MSEPELTAGDQPEPPAQPLSAPATQALEPSTPAPELRQEPSEGSVQETVAPIATQSQPPSPSAAITVASEASPAASQPAVAEPPAPPIASEAPAPPIASEAPAPPIASEPPAPPIASESLAPPIASEAPAPPTASDPAPPTPSELPAPPIASEPAPVPAVSSPAPAPQAAAPPAPPAGQAAAQAGAAASPARTASGRLPQKVSIVPSPAPPATARPTTRMAPAAGAAMRPAARPAPAPGPATASSPAPAAGTPAEAGERSLDEMRRDLERQRMDLAREKLELERLKLLLAQEQAAAGAAGPTPPTKVPTEKVRARPPSSKVHANRPGSPARGGRGAARRGAPSGLIAVGLLGAGVAIAGAVFVAKGQRGSDQVAESGQGSPTAEPEPGPTPSPDQPSPPDGPAKVPTAMRQGLSEVRAGFADAPLDPTKRRAALKALLAKLVRMSSDPGADAAAKELRTLEEQLERALAAIPEGPPPAKRPASGERPGDEEEEPEDPPAREESEEGEEAPFGLDRPRRPPVDEEPERPSRPAAEEGEGEPEPGEEGGPAASPALLRAFLSALQAYDAEDELRVTQRLAEMERLAPDAPHTAAVRGLLADMDGRFHDAARELEKAGEVGGEYTAEPLVRALFATMRYEAARAALPRLSEREQDLWRTLIDGPFRKTYPLAADACVATTPDGHYRVITDLGLPSDFLPKLEKRLQELNPSERGKQVARAARSHKGLQELCDVMDKAYKAYGKLLQSEETQQVFPTVYVLQSRTDFDRFSASLRFTGMENVLGYYVPGFRVLVFYDQPEGRIPGRRLSQGTLEVLLHETFHQWLHLHIDDAPRWFDEGMAEYFGIGEMTSSGLRYGLVPSIHPSRLDNIREALTGGYGEPMALADMIRASRATFYGSNAAVNYAQAWSFVHYLGSFSKGQKLLREYFKALQRGSDQEVAFRDVFGEVDMQAMEREWREYVGRLR